LSEIFELSSRYVEKRAALDPVWATLSGVVGHDNGVTDYSPENTAALAELNRETLASCTSLTPEDNDDRIARDVLVERLTSLVTWYDGGGQWRNLAMIHSPVQMIRGVFDEMPRQTNAQWSEITERMNAVPDSVQSYVSSLGQGVDRGEVVALRQVRAVVEQIRIWTGTAPGSHRYFLSLSEDYDSMPGGDRKVSDELRKAAVRADNAYDELGQYLTNDYGPHAIDVDAVGREHYSAAISRHLGESLDLDETYAWGWDEMHRLDDEIRRVCSQIAPGESLSGVREILDGDFERWIHGERALVEWLNGLLSSTMDRLSEEHFDIPERLKTLQVHVPPPGGPLTPYYIPPTEDFSRPGIVWKPTGGKTRFPMWSEISTAFHEGVPGHHLLSGSIKLNSEHLSRFQRNTEVSGHAEGWCLYAERLMDEIDYLERPEYRLDMLLKALFRSARVVVDIGMHLGLKIPNSEPHFGGQSWTPEIAHQLLSAGTNLDARFIDSEINRYLGAPGQAISYKVGERVWTEIRDELRRREGAQFDLRTFHSKALALGPMGLSQLRSELLG
jgi:uncharacterized protein (DUF885 family)